MYLRCHKGLLPGSLGPEMRDWRPLRRLRIKSWCGDDAQRGLITLAELRMQHGVEDTSIIPTYPPPDSDDEEEPTATDWWDANEAKSETSSDEEQHPPGLWPDDPDLLNAMNNPGVYHPVRNNPAPVNPDLDHPSVSYHPTHRSSILTPSTAPRRQTLLRRWHLLSEQQCPLHLLLQHTVLHTDAEYSASDWIRPHRDCSRMCNITIGCAPSCWHSVR